MKLQARKETHDMPRVNLRAERSEPKFKPLPEGHYLCRVDDIEEAETRNGDAMWKIRFSITEGAYKERRVFDRLVFSNAAQERLAIFCTAFGLDSTGEVDLRPEMFIGKQVFLIVRQDRYTDRQGRDQDGNKVAWDGFRRAVREGEEEIPF
ncbi:MAG: DUF669 domain-containing protein [Candidatus Eisenbacteria bacterium]